MLKKLYALEVTLLLVHEIDSASWKEWELFGLPGGEPGFLLLHLPLVLAALWGFERLLAGARAGTWMALALSAAGLAALAIHGAFLLGGHPEFGTPVSLGLLVASASLALLLGAAALSALRSAPPARAC